MSRSALNQAAVIVGAVAVLIALSSTPAHAGGLIWGSGISQINILAVGAAAALAVLGVVVLGIAIAGSQSQILGYVYYFVGGMSIAASAMVIAPLIIAGATAAGGVDLVTIGIR